MPSQEGGAARMANVFVVVALVAMLVGAVLILLARDVHVLTVSPDDGEVVLFEFRGGAGDPWGHSVRITVFGPANITLYAYNETPSPEEGLVLRVEETTGAAREPESDQVNLSAFQRVSWSDKIRPGEAWRVTAENHHDEAIEVEATVAALSYYYVGGALVGLGILGFVSFRIGMPRGD